MRKSLPLIAALFLACIPAAHAVFVAPDPLLKQLSDGYGVLTVKLAQDEKLERVYEGHLPSKPFRATVESIDLQPVTANFLCTPGDIITIAPNAGPPDENVVQFIVAFDPKTGQYIQSNNMAGAGVKHAISSGDLAQLRKVAALHPDQRIDLALQFIADSSAGDFVRITCLSELQRSTYRSPPPTGPHDTRIADALRATWESGAADMHENLLYQLDYTRCLFESGFYTSKERAAFWMNKAFAPIISTDPEIVHSQIIAQAQIVRDILGTLEYRKVPGVRETLLSKLTTKEIPLYIRAHVANILFTHAVLEKTRSDLVPVEPGLLAAAESGLVEALNSDDNETVLLAALKIGDALAGKVPFDRAPPAYTPDAPVISALNAALDRMKKLEQQYTAANDRDRMGRTSITIDSLETALKSLPAK